VLPFLGPSTLRDALALPIDRKGDLVHYVDERSVRYTLYGVRVVDIRANLLRVGDVLNEAALDKYTFTRDAYLQRRRSEIRGEKRNDSEEGQTPQVDAPAADAPAAPGQPKR
jgi:phospholipid-binding lipoprotein MlaA